MNFKELLKSSRPPKKDEITDEDLAKLYMKYRGLLKQQEREEAFSAATHENIRIAYAKVDKLVEDRTAELRKTNEQLRRDITERKQAEEALKESEENLRTLVESSTDSILTLDPDRRITSCNSSFLNQFGYSREEIIGQPVSIIHPSRESFDLFGQTVYPVVARKDFWRGEWELKRKDGSIFQIETINSAMKRSDGSLRGYVAILRDITERKQAEEELEQHREHLEEMVQKRTAELQSIINSMAGREVRMAGLKETIQKLRAQLEEAGMAPVADDPLKEI